MKVAMEIILTPDQFQELKRSPLNSKKREKSAFEYIEYKLLKSANDLIKGDDTNQDSAQARFDMNDEDDLFCPGFTKRMKKIIPQSRGNLRVQI